MIIALIFVFTLAAYFLTACAYIGLGRLAFFPIIGKLPLKESFFPALWLGWSAALFFLQVWNFFAPVTAAAGILLYAVGLLAFFQLARTRLDELRGALPSAALAPALLIAALWLAGRSMLKVNTWDSGLYHVASIRWLNEYAVVPGLVHLHGRLAFNQSFFAYVAALNFYPLFNHGHNLANSFLMLAVLAEFGASAERTARGRGTPADFAAALLLPPLAYLAATEDLAAPSPNLASALLQILLFVSFARQMEDERDKNANLSFILILSATAVTVKLSNLFFAAAISLPLLALKFLEKAAWREKLRALAYPAAAALLILLVWSARGIILSGCPAYPSTAGCLNLPWSVSPEKALEEAQKTYRFSRYQLEKGPKPLASWEWLPGWVERVMWGNKISVLYPALVFLGAAAALLVFARKAGKYLFIPLPGLAAVLCWFFIAPDLRFAYAFFWILPVSALWALTRVFAESPKAPLLQRAFFLAANASVFVFFALNPQAFGNISLHGYEGFPQPELRLMTTQSGLQLWTPESPIGRCWDAPLPCAQEFNPKLRLLGEGLQSGFALDP